ncbi:hypothetical protein BH10PSE1_BH10PSE1_35780 [soil metagenome]
MLRRFVIAAALLAATSVSAFAQGCDTRFTLLNTSDVAVHEFYFGPSSQSNWGNDRLGDGELPPGRQVSFAPGGRGGNYDFRVVWANGERADLMQVNICATSLIVATQQGLEAH